MGSTPPLELDAGVLERLDAYVATFARDFRRSERTGWSRIYLEGLLLDGERKSIEPLSHRAVVPGNRGNAYQALRRLVSESPWSHEKVLQHYRKVLRRGRAASAFPRSGGHFKRAFFRRMAEPAHGVRLGRSATPDAQVR